MPNLARDGVTIHPEQSSASVREQGPGRARSALSWGPGLDSARLEEWVSASLAPPRPNQCHDQATDEPKPPRLGDPEGFTASPPATNRIEPAAVPMVPQDPPSVQQARPSISAREALAIEQGARLGLSPVQALILYQMRYDARFYLDTRGGAL